MMREKQNEPAFLHETLALKRFDQRVGFWMQELVQTHIVEFRIRHILHNAYQGSKY